MSPVAQEALVLVPAAWRLQMQLIPAESLLPEGERDSSVVVNPAVISLRMQLFQHNSQVLFPL